MESNGVINNESMKEKPTVYMNSINLTAVIASLWVGLMPCVIACSIGGWKEG